MQHRRCPAPSASWMKVQLPAGIYISFLPLLIPGLHQMFLEGCAWVLSRHVCLCQAVELGKKLPGSGEEK